MFYRYYPQIYSFFLDWQKNKINLIGAIENKVVFSRSKIY